MVLKSVVAQCQVFSKIKLVYTELTFAVVYTGNINSFKMAVSLYIHRHCVITQTFAAVKINDSHDRY